MEHDLLERPCVKLHFFGSGNTFSQPKLDGITAENLGWLERRLSNWLKVRWGRSGRGWKTHTYLTSIAGSDSLPNLNTNITAFTNEEGWNWADILGNVFVWAA